MQNMKATPSLGTYLFKRLEKADSQSVLRVWPEYMGDGGLRTDFSVNFDLAEKVVDT